MAIQNKVMSGLSVSKVPKTKDIDGKTYKLRSVVAYKPYAKSLAKHMKPKRLYRIIRVRDPYNKSKWLGYAFYVGPKV